MDRTTANMALLLSTDKVTVIMLMWHLEEKTFVDISQILIKTATFKCIGWYAFHIRSTTNVSYIIS